MVTQCKCVFVCSKGASHGGVSFEHKEHAF